MLRKKAVKVKSFVESTNYLQEFKVKCEAFACKFRSLCAHELHINFHHFATKNFFRKDEHIV